MGLTPIPIPVPFSGLVSGPVSEHRKQLDFVHTFVFFSQVEKKSKGKTFGKRSKGKTLDKKVKVKPFNAFFELDLGRVVEKFPHIILG